MLFANDKHEFEELYTELGSYLGTKPNRSVMFVGAHPRTGTSLVARNFALAAAAHEQSPVLLVDMTGKENTQFNWFMQHHQEQGGAYSYEVDPARLPQRGPWTHHGSNGGTPLPAFRCYWFERINVAVSTCYGAEQPPMLDLQAQEAFWNELHRFFELIVVDCPPRSEGVECTALAPYIDATVLVISAEDTRVPVAAHLRDELEATGARIPGIVFNKRRFYIPDFIYNRMGG